MRPIGAGVEEVQLANCSLLQEREDGAVALEAFEGLASSSERGNPPDPKAFRASASSGDHRRMAVDVQDSFGEGAIQLVLPCDLEQDVHPAEVSAFEQESLEERVVDGKEAAFLAGVEREFVGLACPGDQPGVGQRYALLEGNARKLLRL